MFTTSIMSSLMKIEHKVYYYSHRLVNLHHGNVCCSSSRLFLVVLLPQVCVCVYKHWIHFNTEGHFMIFDIVSKWTCGLSSSSKIPLTVKREVVLLPTGCISVQFVIFLVGMVSGIVGSTCC